MYLAVRIITIPSQLVYVVSTGIECERSYTTLASLGSILPLGRGRQAIAIGCHVGLIERIFLVAIPSPWVFDDYLSRLLVHWCQAIMFTQLVAKLYGLHPTNLLTRIVGTLLDGCTHYLGIKLFGSLSGCHIEAIQFAIECVSIRVRILFLSRNATKIECSTLYIYHIYGAIETSLSHLDRQRIGGEWLTIFLAYAQGYGSLTGIRGQILCSLQHDTTILESGSEPCGVCWGV